MGYGLLQTGQSTKNQAMSGLQNAAQLENNRNQMNENLKSAEKQEKVSTTAAGATTGAMVGMEVGGSAGGPWGAAIGAAAGFLLSELF